MPGTGDCQGFVGFFSRALFQYKTVAEAINGLSGVVIGNSGGLGKQTSIFLRGTESNHTQILLNGVKLAANAFGAPQIEHIPLNLIDRIELVRGPQSSLYGSGSIGGTIQIFTKKARVISHHLFLLALERTVQKKQASASLVVIHPRGTA